MEYERARRIQASPDDVFAFATNARNVPTFVPEVQSLEWVDDGTMRIRIQADDEPVEGIALVSVDANRRRVEWRIDEIAHHGWLSVSGVDGASEAVAHLSLTPRVSESGRPLEATQHETDDLTQERLDSAMDRLRELIEGQGSTEQPAAT